MTEEVVAVVARLEATEGETPVAAQAEMQAGTPEVAKAEEAVTPAAKGPVEG